MHNSQPFHEGEKFNHSPVMYRVKFEADLCKKSTIKRSFVHLDVEVQGDFIPENFERFMLGKKVGANWTVLSAKYVSKKATTP